MTTDDARGPMAGLGALKPLTGVRVLDFTQLIAGPSATMLLGDMGAEVIKIEQPSGDLARSLDPNSGGSAAFEAYNRSKKSLVVNLKTAGGVELIERLVAVSDVVVEGFRPGVADRLGIGYEQLLLHRSDLVYASLSAFGSESGDRMRPGVDSIVQAEAGVMSITGDPDGEPVKVGFQFVDAASGIVLAQSILAALILRDRTGDPQRVETSLFDVAVFLQSPAFLEASQRRSSLPRPGNTAGSLGYPTDLFETEDGRYLELAAYFPRQWTLLCGALGLEHLEHDPRFSDNSLRTRNMALLRQHLAEAMRTRTADEWHRRLSALGIIAGVVREHHEILRDRKDRRIFRWTPREQGDRVGIGHPVAASWSTDADNSLPEIGEHTEEILLGLGYADDEIERLRSAGII